MSVKMSELCGNTSTLKKTKNTVIPRYMIIPTRFSIM